MNDSTDLARGTLNGADELAVQLIRSADMPAAEHTLKPAVVNIVWPPASTVVDPKRFPEVAAQLTRTLRRIRNHPGPTQSQVQGAAVNDTFQPRRHGCLWEIMSAIVGLIAGLAIVAAIIVAAAYFMGHIR